jgi:hypothetical protein
MAYSVEWIAGSGRQTTVTLSPHCCEVTAAGRSEKPLKL